jgi:hypothetical protein
LVVSKERQFELDDIIIKDGCLEHIFKCHVLDTTVEIKESISVDGPLDFGVDDRGVPRGSGVEDSGYFFTTGNQISIAGRLCISIASQHN